MLKLSDWACTLKEMLTVPIWFPVKLTAADGESGIPAGNQLFVEFQAPANAVPVQVDWAAADGGSVRIANDAITPINASEKPRWCGR